MKSRCWLIVAVLIMIGILVPVSQGCTSSEKAPAKAQEVVLLSNEAPSNFYTFSTNWAKLLAQNSKVKAVVRVMPSVTSRYALMREGEGVAGVNSGMLFEPAVYGDDIYADAAWGPQRFRAIFVSKMCDPLAVMTAKDSGIKTLADLKGKRVVWHEGAPGRQLLTECYLAFAGLTWKDVTKVPAPGYNQAVQMLMDGKADAAYGALGSAIFKEMEAGPKGCVVLPIPHNNKAGWDAMTKAHLGQVPWIATMGPGDPKQYPMEVSGHYFYGQCGPALADDVVYALADTAIMNGAEFIKGLDWFKPEEISLAVCADKQVREFCPMPYHTGFIKFLKDKKVWNAEMEAWQQKKLADEDKRIADWKAKLK